VSLIEERNEILQKNQELEQQIFSLPSKFGSPHPTPIMKIPSRNQLKLQWFKS
jgi:hypothetical protein